MKISHLDTFRPPQPGAAASRKMLNSSIDENTLHLSLVEHIRRRARPQVFWTHIPSGERRPPGVGGKLKGMGLKAGIPDFMFIDGGPPRFLELKRVDGRLRSDQVDTIEQLRAAGAVVDIAYGLDEALRILTEWGFIR